MSSDFLKYLMQQHVLKPEQTQKLLILARDHPQPLEQLLLEQRLLKREEILFWRKQFLQNQPKMLLKEHLSGAKQALPVLNSEAQTALDVPSVPQESTDRAPKPKRASDILMKVDELAKATKKVPTANQLSSDSASQTMRETHPETLSEKNTSEKIVEPLLKNEKKEERYQVLETLGEGGMGVVQRVQDRILNREVALKKIKISKSLSKIQQKMLWRLQREAEITGVLEHPNIVPLYDMQKGEQGDLYFTMRKVKGETFSHILKEIRTRKEIYNENKILSIYLKICDAVAYAHAEGIIHRDLKPDNVMVGSFGEVYVMDWGIAKKRQEPDLEETEDAETEPSPKYTAPSEFMTIGGLGTPGYMAPEQQKKASQATPPSDIYALGKMLRQCFTLLSPIEEPSFLNKQKNTALALQNLDAKVPLDIQAIVQKATQAHPDDRYQSVQELVEDLQQYLHHERVSVREYTTWEVFQKWLKRNRQKVLFGSIIGTLCIGFPFYFQLQKYLQNQREFRKAFQNAINFRKGAESKAETGRSSRHEKMENLLESFNELNRARTLQEGNGEVEQIQKEVGESLISLCFEEQDYQLAQYIARTMQHLQHLNLNEKQKFISDVEIERNRTCKEHLQRLDFWFTRFKNGEQQEGERDDALFEISKMPEEEVFQELLARMHEGTTKFINDQIQNSLEEEYYLFVVEALGRLENTKAGNFLMSALEAMASELEKQEKKKESLVFFRYLYFVTEALGNSRSPNQTLRLQKFYDKMRLYEGFESRTKLAHKKLAEVDIKNLRPQTAEDYYQRGRLQKELKNLESAISDFTQAIQFNSKESLYYSARAKIFEFQGKYTQSLDDQTLAITLSPEKTEHYINRAIVKMYLNDLSGAHEDYNRAIQLDPENIFIYQNRYALFTIENNYMKALDDLNRAIQIAPLNHENYSNRAIIRIRQGDYYTAIKDCDRAIQIHPKFFPAYMNRGLARSHLGDYENTLHDYNQCVLLSPKNEKCYYNRAEIRLFLKDPANALTDINQAIFLQPVDPSDYYLLRGKIYLELKEFDRAFADFTQAIQTGNNLFAYYNRILLSLQQKKYTEALEDCHYLLNNIPADQLTFRSEIYFVRGQTHLGLKNLSESIQDFNQVISQNPQHLSSYYYRGIANSQIPDEKKALVDFRYYLSLSQEKQEPEIIATRESIFQSYPELKSSGENISSLEEKAEATFKQAIALDKEGNLNEALGQYNETLHLNPKHVRAFICRGYLYYRQKKLKEAIQNFDRALQLDSNAVDAYLFRGTVKTVQKDVAGCLQDFSDCIRVAPQDYRGYANRGMIHSQIGDADSAKKDFIQAIELTQDSQEPQALKVRETIFKLFPDLKTK